MATFPILADTVPPIAQAGRKAWAALEPMHNLLYFDPAAEPCYAEVGIVDPRLSYFAARACPLGVTPAEVVVSTFYNFNPVMITGSMPRIWKMSTPEAVIGARFQAADRCLRPLLGSSIDSPEMAEALALARAAAEEAGRHPLGRPLFAAHAALDWPEQPHVQLWWAQTLLREFRGDGHQATLMSVGVTGLEALVLYVATEKVDGEGLRLTRGWPSRAWRSCVSSLQEAGLLTDDPDLTVTSRGAALRTFIENQTDLLASPAYDVLGVDGATRLATLGAALNEPVIAADVIPWLKKRPVASRRGRVRAVARSR
jgi:helix-turn-helix protein